MCVSTQPQSLPYLLQSEDRDDDDGGELRGEGMDASSRYLFKIPQEQIFSVIGILWTTDELGSKDERPKQW